MEFDYEDYEGLDGKGDERPPRKKPAVKTGGKEVTAEEIIKKAVHAYRKGDFSEVVTLLDLMAEQYPKDDMLQKLIGMAKIHTGFPKDAERYLKRALSVNRNDPEALNALSYIELTKENQTAAVNQLLDALFVDEENEKLQKNLEKIREMRDIKSLLSVTPPSGYLFLELPDPKLGELALEKIRVIFQSPLARIIAGGGILIVVVLFLVAFWPGIMNFFSRISAERMGGATGEHLSINDIDDLLEERENFDVSLTVEESAENYYLAREHIYNGEHNLARYLLNTLINSDTDEIMREQAYLLEEFLPDPDPLDIDYNPSYSDVIVASYLFEGCYIKWIGTISGSEHIGRDETVFDLLINVSDSVVDGIAEVHFDEYVHVMNNETVAVYGTIAGITLDNAVILRGDFIERLD